MEAFEDVWDGDVEAMDGIVDFVTTEVRKVWRKNVGLKGRLKVLEEQMEWVVEASECLKEIKGVLNEVSAERKRCLGEGVPVDVVMGDGDDGVNRREKK